VKIGKERRGEIKIGYRIDQTYNFVFPSIRQAEAAIEFNPQLDRARKWYRLALQYRLEEYITLGIGELWLSHLV